MKQLLAVLLCICLPLALVAQSNANPPVAKSAATGSLSVEDVIKLSKAGIDEILIQQSKKQGQPFDLSQTQRDRRHRGQGRDTRISFRQSSRRRGTRRGGRGMVHIGHSACGRILDIDSNLSYWRHAQATPFCPRSSATS